ncbi:uncharacterized protein MONBRDRAFT_23009 [Monosiga brevicollis MX1]|uniref:Uncharacterized protein n=1 Tax=Monosiga brevicollis TaxID=81824 RepID=A9USR1_MONBE|nr:uncharacterized protein MONBRDRAFT_23009 [Monosiga brevicollis MX1]EDQ91823.1 predicted protein [Monosiga brevicollis MX1]|eukprot:XP_001743109.1 hypothetical protein [Monosiga brevicollis MX1]
MRRKRERAPAKAPASHRRSLPPVPLPAEAWIEPEEDPYATIEDLDSSGVVGLAGPEPPRYAPDDPLLTVANHASSWQQASDEAAAAMACANALAAHVSLPPETTSATTHFNRLLYELQYLSDDTRTEALLRASLDSWSHWLRHAPQVAEIAPLLSSRSLLPAHPDQAEQVPASFTTPTVPENLPSKFADSIRLADQSWFHGILARDQAEARLAEAMAGCYLFERLRIYAELGEQTVDEEALSRVHAKATQQLSASADLMTAAASGSMALAPAASPSDAQAVSKPSTRRQIPRISAPKSRMDIGPPLPLRNRTVRSRPTGSSTAGVLDTSAFSEAEMQIALTTAELQERIQQLQHEVYKEQRLAKAAADMYDMPTGSEAAKSARREQAQASLARLASLRTTLRDYVGLLEDGTPAAV